ncbi:hypothetical protein ABT354_16095 [Streptomyces sp. NPDC000594]|uniref:hypothetical protein n=1 Tax=Streptomyces sp. NPDC000594 TaxID=3154261 RepID=UPI00332A0A9E
MRFRVSVAVVSGALAATALAAPAAQAADGQSARSAVKGFAATADDIRDGDTRITGVSINGGKPIVLGVSEKKKVTATITATDSKGIRVGGAWLWRGKSAGKATDGILADKQEFSCSNQGTKGTCKVTFTLDPTKLYINDRAGAWKLAVFAEGKDADGEVKFNYRTVTLQRASKLTVNAAPEPVVKGKTLTVTGALTRANWESLNYKGYTAQPVKLQYRAKNATSYTTLKTVKTDSKGNLKTTVKATADGYYRYAFAGTSTTPAVTTAGDFVDVR